MADATRAIGWILSQNSFNVKIESAEWIGEILPGWTDICCTVNFGDREVVAWGASDSTDVALLKAFAEAAERGVFLKGSAGTSNGFAAHLNREDARKNALNELLERDLFLCHFLTNTPFKSLDVSLLKDSSQIARINAFSTRLGLRTRYFHLGRSGVLCVCDGLFNQPKVGFVVGASYKEDINLSFLGATVETLRQAHFNEKLRVNRQLKVLTLSQFSELAQPRFEDHGALALDVEYAESISNLFENVATVNINQVDSNCISIIDLPWIDEGYCPFFFAQASASRAQQMFVGLPKKSKLNLDRLMEASGSRQINSKPHPFN